MKFCIPTFCFCTLCTWASSQSVSDLPANSFPFNLSGQTVMTFDERYAGIAGSPVLFENFLPGKVVLKSGQIFENVLINYDCVADNLLAKSSQYNGWVIVRKDIVVSFSIYDKAKQYNFEKKILNRSPLFFCELTSDSISLLKRFSKAIQGGGDFSGAYNTSEYKQRQFVLEEKYYAEISNDLVEVPTKIKAFIKLFPQQEEQLKEFFNKNRVKLNDVDDLKLLFVYLNGLM